MFYIDTLKDVAFGKE